MQQDILSELVEIDQLSDALDVVNILLRFLSSGGGKADSRFDVYLKKLRMDERSFSKLVSLICMVK